MKIAVVSDIHGNNTAFKAVLEDIEKFNVEGVIIAGDNIGDGPNPREVVDKISSMKAWVVKGNKEEKVLLFQMMYGLKQKKNGIGINGCLYNV